MCFNAYGKRFLDRFLIEKYFGDQSTNETSYMLTEASNQRSFVIVRDCRAILRGSVRLNGHGEATAIHRNGQMSLGWWSLP